MDFALRVTITNDQTGERLIEFCNKYFDEGLAVYENKDDDCHNEHYHVHGFTTVKEETLRKSLQRLFPKTYSIKEADERNLQYICKGKVDEPPVVVWTKGTQYDCPRVYWERYWEEFVAKNGEYDPDYASRRDVTNAVLITRVIEKLPNQWFDVKDKARVCQLMFDTWHEAGKVLNVYQARSYYYEIAYKLAPSDDAKFLLCQSLAEHW